MRMARILQVQGKKWFGPLVFVGILVSPKKLKKKEGGHFIFKNVHPQWTKSYNGEHAL
jgi:hypothetical protein